MAQETSEVEIPDRQDRPNPTIATIDALCGKYKQHLSSSEEFAQKRKTEITQ